MDHCLSSNRCGCVAPEPVHVLLSQTITFPVTNKQIGLDVMIDIIIAASPRGPREVSINEDTMVVTLKGKFDPAKVLKVLQEYEEYVDLQHFNYQEATSQ